RRGRLSMRTRRHKSEQMALSRNSRNASRNTKTPVGSDFIILVPTVPTQNQYLYMRVRNISLSTVKINFSSIQMVSREKKSESRNKRRKRPWGAGFDVPTSVPTVP